MSIAELGAIGEFVGAIAVVVTLIYLAVQIRQNTSSNRAMAHQTWPENSASTNTFAKEMYAFRERAYHEPETLNAEEKAKSDYYFVQALHTLEAMYFMWRLGSVDGTYWQSKVRTIAFFAAFKGFRLCWGEYRPIFDERFAGIVDEEIAKAST